VISALRPNELIKYKHSNEEEVKYFDAIMNYCTLVLFDSIARSSFMGLMTFSILMNHQLKIQIIT